MKAPDIETSGFQSAGAALFGSNSSLDSGENTKTESLKNHIPISKWLTTIGLSQYMAIFKNYKGVQDIMHLTEGDLKNLGIKSGAHRANIASSLYLLKEKLLGKKIQRKPDVTGSPVGSNRSTPTHTPPSYTNHPDYAPVTMQYQPLHGGGGSPQPFNPTDYQLHNQKEISKHLWYHGAIPRTKAENLVKEEGDFLVRDSISQKGDFVLTCYWNNVTLHFMINRQSVMDSASGVIKMQYQFENDLCDTVPQLINSYVKNRKPVSEASSACISNPINRRISADSLNLLSSPANRNQISVGSSPSSPFIGASSHNFSGFTTHKRPKRTGSQPLLSFDDDLAIEDNLDRADSVPTIVMSTNIRPKLEEKSTLNIHNQFNHVHVRADSEPVLLIGPKLKRSNLSKSKEALATSDSDLTKPLPPKPSRVPTVKLKNGKRPKVLVRNKQLYVDENDYSDYEAIKSWPQNVERTIDDRPMFATLESFYDSPINTQLRTSDGSTGSNNSNDSGYGTQDGHTYDPVALKLPDLNPPSKFNLEKYCSQILTSNNKPLESSALSVILPMLLGADPKLLALHSTVLDLDLLRIIGNHDLGLGVKSGLELITLPQGEQLRKDTLERFHCMKFFVAGTILLCVKYLERAKMIHIWIQAASHMKAIGNLFGFAYIMDGIQCEQIKRLKNTWIAAKHHHLSSTLIYEAKLRNTYKALCEAGNALPLQNICLPYILPLVDLLERDNTHQQLTFTWEQEDVRSDMGIDIILAHLDIARIITEQHGLYKVTSLNVLANFTPIRDMLEIVDTRMHLKFLWGAKAAGASTFERYSKFSQIMSAMSFKCEPQNSMSIESSL